MARVRRARPKDRRSRPYEPPPPAKPRCPVLDKVRHEHPHDAQAARRDQYGQHKVDEDRRLGIFRCRHCGGFHVGTYLPA